MNERCSDHLRALERFKVISVFFPISTPERSFVDAKTKKERVCLCDIWIYQNPLSRRTGALDT